MSPFTRKQIKQKTTNVRSRTEVSPHPSKKGTGSAWCPDCTAVLRKKKWIDDPKLHAQLKTQKAPKKQCPVDEMRKLQRYEGLVILSGLAKLKNRNDLLNLIENEGEAAKKQDFQDQILNMKVTRDSIRLELSDNQLATRLGRKITRAFPQTKKRVERAKGESLATVYLTIE